MFNHITAGKMKGIFNGQRTLHMYVVSLELGH